MVQLGPDGGKYLSGVILNNKVLEHLVLNNCELTDEGAIPIADGELGMRMCVVIDRSSLNAVSITKQPINQAQSILVHPTLLVTSWYVQSRVLMVQCNVILLQLDT